MTQAANEKTKNNAVPEEPEMGLLAHLFELRDRLLRIVLGIVVLFIGLFPFANDLYTFLSGPLTQHLPEGSSMIAVEVASPFLIPFKLVLMLAFVLSLPWTLHQIWGFIAPGLYKHEKRLAFPLLASSVALFYIGMAFAYYVVFPLVFGFFTSVAPEGVAVMTDISHYLDFVLMLFLAFGIAFEVPIATILLVITGVTSPDKLAEKRPYVIVVAFIVGMLLTPPDVISQVLLAIPMWILFEFGIIMSRFFIKEREKREKEEESENSITPYSSDDEDYYSGLSDEEMEAELDKMDAEEDAEQNKAKDADAEKKKLAMDKKEGNKDKPSTDK